MKRIAMLPIAMAVIWGAVMIACTITLKGTEYKDQVLQYVGGGAAASFLVTVGAASRRNREES